MPTDQATKIIWREPKPVLAALLNTLAARVARRIRRDAEEALTSASGAASETNSTTGASLRPK